MILRKQVEQSLRTVRAAFTLMELLVVVSIIVVLAGLGGYMYLRTAEDAKKAAAVTQIKATLVPAVETYKLRNDVWPESLQVLLQRDEAGNPPLLKNVEAITTPWGGVYQLDLERTQALDQPVIFCQTRAGETLSNVPLQ